MKKILLALALAFASTTAVAQDSLLTRDQFKAECRASAVQGNVPKEEYGPVCNCATQLLSYMYSNGVSKFAEFTISPYNPAATGTIQYCRQAYEASPYTFSREFGELDASIR